MEETFEKISENQIKMMTTTEVILDINALKEELYSIDDKITELNNMPDNIMVVNDEKIIGLTGCQIRKNEIEKILNQIK